jgi:hypothetical protein
MAQPEERGEEARLLEQIAANIEELEALLRRHSDMWGYEDPVYRFYHQSFKVYHLQASTEEIVEALQRLAPHRVLNAWFTEIVAAGTGKSFQPSDNARWTETTRPILEAFFHARYFLEMTCRYGRELSEPPTRLPSGWAAVLYLYGLR